MSIKEKVKNVVKSNIDAKKYKLAVDRAEVWFFSLPPSFYAILAGALIGTVTNLLTGLTFAQEGANIKIVYVISFLLLSSSVCFCIISIKLEQLRAEVPGEGEFTRKLNFRGEIGTQRKSLWPLLLIGYSLFVIVIIGIIFIW